MRTGKIAKPIIAGIGASFLDGYIVNPLLAKMGFNIGDDVGRIVVGIGGQMLFKRKGLLKDVFQAEAVIGSFLLGNKLAGTMIGTTTNGSTTTGKVF